MLYVRSRLPPLRNPLFLYASFSTCPFYYYLPPPTTMGHDMHIWKSSCQWLWPERTSLEYFRSYVSWRPATWKAVKADGRCANSGAFESAHWSRRPGKNLPWYCWGNEPRRAWYLFNYCLADPEKSWITKKDTYRNWKPGLTKAKSMRDARLACCLEHQDWTLENWNNVILLHRLGEYWISLCKIQSLLEFESLVI